MEVHAHTHTPRKKWTHYFWEFLMLFLAVFCGFLAENQREHYIEHQREKQYMISLVKDIRYDTLMFSQTLAGLNNKLPQYDSVLYYLDHQTGFGNVIPGRFFLGTVSEIIYTPIEPTIQQLKNSGNLRLIRKKNVLDTILIYQSNIDGPLLNQTNYVVEFNQRLLEQQHKILNYKPVNTLINDLRNDNVGDSLGKYDLSFFINDKEEVQRLYNLFIAAKSTDFFYLQNIEKRKNEAVGLINLIEKEYHLK